MHKNICIYGGSYDGNLSIYTRKAQELGRLIAQQGRRLIYGGGSSGLIGIIANSVLQHGGEVYGIIPQSFVEAKKAHMGITKLDVVINIHIRKARIMELADAFIIMPGGVWTLHEFFDIWVATQTEECQKPLSLFNIGNFYSPFLQFLEYSIRQGFISQHLYQTLLISNNANNLLVQLDNHYQTQKIMKYK